MNATAETLPLHQTFRKAGAAQAWVLILTMFLPILAIIALAPALPTLHDEWWFILNAATLHLQTPAKFEAGITHEINVELGLLLPYILVGPNADTLTIRNFLH